MLPAKLLPFLFLTSGLWGGSTSDAVRLRPSILAGGWYPAEAQELTTLLEQLLEAAPAPDPAALPVRALILPHAGYAYSGTTAARGVATVRGRQFERVLILAPSHHSSFSGLSIADVDAYQTPLGNVALDAAAVATLRRSEWLHAQADAHAREHSIEIHLPLLQHVLEPGWRLLPILVGDIQVADYPALAALLQPFMDASTLVVISSDFTHYGRRFNYLPFAINADTPAALRALDSGAIERIQARDATGLLAYQQTTGITVCGIRPIVLLLMLLPDTAQVQLLQYVTSGAMTGDYSHSVSYAAFTIRSAAALAIPAPPKPLDTAALALLHQFALIGIDQAIFGEQSARTARLQALEAQLPPVLKRHSGVFVTLRKDGGLRGCIGYILPERPLYQAVLENGYNAASRDRRFNPVTAAELSHLQVEISVLTPPEPINSPDEFRVGEQGIILAKAGHSAVFLPEVAIEQGWDRITTLSQLALKAGLPATAWQQGATFQVFTSQHYGAAYVNKH